MQEFAPDEDQVSVRGWPTNTSLRFEERATVGAAITVTVVDPDLEVSWVEVAVTVAVPAAVAVKTPLLVMVPILAGLTDQVTELL